MADDISAAKHYRQAIATVCEGFTLPDAARKVLETALWNLPTESATTPAEVDGSEGFVPLPNIVIREPGPEADDHAAFVEHCADLLSKSGKRLTGRTLAESATLIRALARQLAEAKAETVRVSGVYEIVAGSVSAALARAGVTDCDDPGEAIDVMREKAERRLGEVEGLVGKWRGLLERAVPFIRDDAENYEDDGSNEPLELAREIESLLASSPSDESALSSASLAFDGGAEAAHPSRGVVDDRSPSYDALLIIVQSVCGALDRAGIEECDDPGEAIDVMRERYEARIQAAALPAATTQGDTP